MLEWDWSRTVIVTVTRSSQVAGVRRVVQHQFLVIIIIFSIILLQGQRRVDPTIQQADNLQRIVRVTLIDEEVQEPLMWTETTPRLSFPWALLVVGNRREWLSHPLKHKTFYGVAENEEDFVTSQRTRMDPILPQLWNGHLQTEDTGKI